MNSAALFQNLIQLLIMGIILEATIMAIFSITVLKKFGESNIGKILKDFLILGLALFLCVKIKSLTIFSGTGVKTPYLFDIIVSSLVLSRISYFIRDMLIKLNNE